MDPAATQQIVPMTRNRWVKPTQAVSSAWFVESDTRTSNARNPATKVVDLPKPDEPGRESFDDYVRTHRGALVRYALLLCGSQAVAEDLVQEVLARVFLRWDSLDAQRGRRAYLQRSITNEFLSWRRRWSTRTLHYVDGSSLTDIADNSPHHGHDDELWSALHSLPRRQHAAVVLRYYEGLSDAEIAEVLRCGTSTVRAHISRALATLRTQPNFAETRKDPS
jgi:RNA polymerase sigma-70 factor (sigma-E family)